MIVELFGLAGSGKSSLRRQLAPKSKFQTIKISSKRELLYYNVTFFVKNPLKSILLFIIVLKNSESFDDFYYKFMNCFLDYNAKSEKAKRFEYAILDQGYFQNFISLFSQPINKKQLRTYLSLIKFPDYLIVVEIDEGIRKKRLLEREQSARSYLSEEELMELKKVSIENYKKILDILPKTDLSYLRMNTNNRLDECIEQIKKLSSE